ncbi:MAG TPA: tetratricopeptide repeat protein [Thermoanaerobaculia bacterium]|nr:tetratricopeptide repeat protein [Thermoanaerobaculia bacterium]
MRRSLALGALVLAAFASNAFAIGEARATGKIIDAATKQPLKDAVVTVQAIEGKTFKHDYPVKADGTYAIFILDGTIHYDFTYSAPGHQPYKEPGVKLKLIPEKNDRGDVPLAPLGATTTATPRPAAAPKPDPSTAAFNAGAEMANAGDVPGAITKIEEAVAAKPELVAGYQALAKLYVRQKDWAKAIDRANKAVALDPDEPDMYSVLFEAYNATGDKAKAAEAKKKMPANAAVAFNDAAKLLNAGKDGEAEGLLKQAVAIDDKFAAAYYELGMIYVRAGKNADARTNLEKYLELDPKGKDAATAKEMLNYVK